MVAGYRFSENTDELARLDPQVQEREEALPLRERIKNIFKKYGWTLQAVALAVGIVLSALALAATNGLKAGTKAIGNGLKAIGQKLGSLLPGLIGSIVSYIFKAAGSVLSFLGEHAWLLILAVVAFFMKGCSRRSVNNKPYDRQGANYHKGFVCMMRVNRLFDLCWRCWWFGGWRWLRWCGFRRFCNPLVFSCLLMNWVWRVAVWRVNLAWSTRHQLQRGLLRVLINLVVHTQLHIIRCPAEVIIITHNAFRVDDHAGGQE